MMRPDRLPIGVQDLRHPWPNRLLHWIYGPAVLVSALSGFYLSRPGGRPGGRLGRPSLGFRTMTSAQKTHAISQFILAAAVLARVYRGLATRDYEEIVPRKRDLAEAPNYLSYEAFLKRREPRYPKYNPLQKIVFTLLGALLPLQGLVGLSLYRPGLLPGVVALAGGLGPLRRLHYLGALLIASLSAGHVYLVLTHSLSRVKSIFTGRE